MLTATDQQGQSTFTEDEVIEHLGKAKHCVADWKQKYPHESSYRYFVGYRPELVSAVTKRLNENGYNANLSRTMEGSIDINW